MRRAFLKQFLFGRDDPVHFHCKESTGWSLARVGFSERTASRIT
jgi:hypothetical protein